MGFYVEVEPGTKLYVEDLGTGKPVLLIHGWPVDHHMYEYQTAHLPTYGYRCISIDLRGFGLSDSPWGGYSYDQMADDIRTVIDTLRLEDISLAGFSMGGAVAIRYMARHSGHKVSQLILLSAAAPSFTQGPGFPYGKTKAEVDQLIAGIETDRPHTLEAFGQQFFASAVTPSFRNWFQLLGLNANAHATAATAVSLRDEDLRPDLPKIHTPTAIFHGILDQVCPFPLAVAMNNGIRDSILIRFEHSGHGVFYDELELFNRNLLMVLSHRFFTI